LFAKLQETEGGAMSNIKSNFCFKNPLTSGQMSSIVFLHVTKADKKAKSGRMKQRQNDDRLESVNYSISPFSIISLFVR